MKPMNPEVMLKQVGYAGDLLRNDFEKIDRNVRACFSHDDLKRIRRVYALGDGDSWFAAMALEMAFLEFAGVDYFPTNAMQFQSYAVDAIPLDFPETNLIVGISASGGSVRVVQSMEKVQVLHDHLKIVSLIGKVDSSLGKLSRHVIHAEIPQFGPSPGILTYMASMLGLYALALYIGEVKGILSADEVEAKKKEIIGLADGVDQTLTAAMEVGKAAAKAVSGADFMSFVGSGPGYGTAWFSGAKVVEAAGVFCPAQDLEEWAHVEGLAYPMDFPVYLIAQPGKAYWRAEKLAGYQKILGHKLMIVADAEDIAMQEKADYFFPVFGNVAEVFSPLAYFVPSCVLACYSAIELDRLPFMMHDEESSKRSAFVTKQIKDQATQ